METTKPSITAILEHFGADCSRVTEYGKTKIKCPFHEDNSPSGWVNMDTQRYSCFAGCEGGDAYDLIEHYEDGIEGFKDAADWIERSDLDSGSVEVCQASSGTGRPWRPPWSADADGDLSP